MYIFCQCDKFELNCLSVYFLILQMIFHRHINCSNKIWYDMICANLKWLSIWEMGSIYSFWFNQSDPLILISVVWLVIVDTRSNLINKLGFFPFFWCRWWEKWDSITQYSWHWSTTQYHGLWWHCSKGYLGFQPPLLQSLHLSLLFSLWVLLWLFPMALPILVSNITGFHCSFVWFNCSSIISGLLT